MGRALWVALAFGPTLMVTLGALPGEARAQPLPSSRYSLDLFQGPLLAPIRVSGIAGAYAGYAEGIAGMVANAAAPALREPFSASYLELDIDLSISIPLSLTENDDFDNSGVSDSDYSSFLYLAGGGIIQYGPFGIGGIAELQRYTIDGDGGATDVTVGKYRALVAWQFFGDQLVVGGGVRIATLGLDAPDVPDLTIVGVAPEFGAIVRPDWKSFRVGATFRAPVDGGTFYGGGTKTIDESGIVRAGPLVLPERVVLPWEVEVGVAVQVGSRPLNPAWLNPHDQEALGAEAFARRREERKARREAELAAISDPRERAQRAQKLSFEEKREQAADDVALGRLEDTLKQERRARYWNWPRQYLLLTAELLATGPVDRGVSLERFLGQNERRPARGRSVLGRPVIGSSGQGISYSPRFGIETEPVENLLKTRFGSYYEPSRFRDVGRQHFTFGADLRMFATTWFGLVPEVIYKLQASVDIAPRYESYSLGIGVWR